MLPLARIVLRYGTGALAAHGFIDADIAKMIQGDADILGYTQLALSAVLMGITEGWYWLAKRRGWRT